MRILLTLTFWAVIASASATEITQPNPASQERTTVLVELSNKSGLPSGDLSKILSDCSGSQQNMYFCAWRDQIGASLELDRVLANKHQQFPKCKAFMSSKVEKWARSRDISCAKSATNEFGQGSMKPTAQAMCVTAETVKMTKRLERLKGCGKP